MGFWRDIFGGGAVLRERLASSESRVRFLEERLEREVNANREREDALLNKILIASGHRQAPYRDIDVKAEKGTPELEGDFDDESNRELESMIRMRAREFQRAAAENGQEVELAVYEEIIRRSPDEYLVN